MRTNPLKSEQDYEKCLTRLEEIFDAAPDTKQWHEAETLTMLIENYENKNYPIDTPDPLEQ